MCRYEPDGAAELLNQDFLDYQTGDPKTIRVPLITAPF